MIAEVPGSGIDTPFKSWSINIHYWVWQYEGPPRYMAPQDCSSGWDWKFPKTF